MSMFQTNLATTHKGKNELIKAKENPLESPKKKLLKQSQQKLVKQLSQESQLQGLAAADKVFSCLMCKPNANQKSEEFENVDLLKNHLVINLKSREKDMIQWGSYCRTD